MRAKSSKYRKAIKFIALIAILFVSEGIIFFLLNEKVTIYYTDDEVRELKTNMFSFSDAHKNHGGLFIDPKINANYYAVLSINFSSSAINQTDLIDLTREDNAFFLSYFLEKQNRDGSFSDDDGMGTVDSTYSTVKMIDVINPNKITERSSSIQSYVRSRIDEDGWGFKSHQDDFEANIISTSKSINLSDRFGDSQLLNNPNITNFIDLLVRDPNSGMFLGFYRLSNHSLEITPETTYYGIKSHIDMNMTAYNFTERFQLIGYLNSSYNINDGGYGNNVTNPSDIVSTYYTTKSLYMLNATPINETKTAEFVASCVNVDGDISIYPNNYSDFESSLLGLKTLRLINAENSTATASLDLNQIEVNYYKWLYEHQSQKGLFGYNTLEVNYLGVLSAYNYNSTIMNKIVNGTAIWEFVQASRKSDGGYRLTPDSSESSIYATFCAIKIFDILSKSFTIVFTDKSKTITYISEEQNQDGGFRVGNDWEKIEDTLFYFEGLYPIRTVKKNISNTKSSYWAIESLKSLNSIASINKDKMLQWLSSCQNLDGGFSIVLGFYSDIVSTYEAMEIFGHMNIDPPSLIDVIKFVKIGEDNGSFVLFPSLMLYEDMSPNFVASYSAALILYNYGERPESIKNMTKWFEDCISNTTGGVGDSPSFGGDLRNTPYGMEIIEKFQDDQNFKTGEWIIFLLIIVSEIVLLSIFLLGKGLSVINRRREMNTRRAMLIDNSKNFVGNYAVSCEDLSVYLGRMLIIDSITLYLKHGQILGVLGESGAGKSTFIKALIGMIKYKGTTELYGSDSRKNRKNLRMIYGFVPQDLGKMYHKLTVMHNLQYFGKLCGLTEREVFVRGKRLLRRLNIIEKIDQKVEELSGGEQRRVSIAIALIHEPSICILDEPTSGLDPVIRENLWMVLMKINKDLNTTLIVITHHPDEARFCHKVAIFARGRGLIDLGSQDDLISSLPGRGRTIELTFKSYQMDALKRLGSLEGVERVLENKVGAVFLIYSDLNQAIVKNIVVNEFGTDSIKGFAQTDSKMEEYFRYKMVDLPSE